MTFIDSRECYLTSVGNTLEISLQKYKNQKQPSHLANCHRSKIKGFSDASRLRLSRALARTDWKEQPVHITLTYPRLKHPHTQQSLKKDLKSLEKFFRQRGVYGYWRLEFQNRQQAVIDYLSTQSCWHDFHRNYWNQFQRAGHWHILIDSLSKQQERSLVQYWKRRTGNATRFGVKITRRDQTKASWYLAMHHAKKDDQSPDISIGRVWGYFGKATVMQRQIPKFYGQISARQEIRLYRILRKIMRVRYRKARTNMTIFMTEYQQLRLLRYLKNLDTVSNPATNGLT